MRFAAVLLGASSLMLTGQALADERCDWFQNALIGTRCLNSAAVTVTLDYDHYDYGWTSLGWPVFFQSLRSTDEHLYPGLSFAITPTPWLTLEFDSQYAFDSRRWSYTSPFGFFPQSSNNAYAYRQTLVANINVIDTGPGNQRFVLNAFGGGLIVPGHDGYSQVATGYGGLTANYQVRLGSGFSLDARGEAQIDSRSPNDNIYVYTSARLLISNDSLGLAVGPVLDTARWLSSGLSVSPQDTYYAAGGSIIWQPFRSSPSLWNGVIVQSTAEHSIGPANFIPASEAKTSQFDVTTSIGFHFRY